MNVDLSSRADPKSLTCSRSLYLMKDDNEVPKTRNTSVQRIVSDLDRRVHNIPYTILQARVNSSAGSCSRMPSIAALKINNVVWQRFEHPDITLFLYSAHLDIREKNPVPAIRIFTTMSRPEISVTSYPYCQIWLKDIADPILVRSSNFRFTGWDGIWNKTDETIMTTPHMFDCPLFSQ